MDQTLSLSGSRQNAVAHQSTYKRVLYVVLGLETVMAIYAFLAPASFSSLLSLPQPVPAGWVMGWGVLLLFAVVLHIPGVLEPVLRRWSNAVGIVVRTILALLYLCLWGGFLWLALIEGIAAGLLGLLYYRLFVAELMSRP